MVIEQGFLVVMAVIALGLVWKCIRNDFQPYLQTRIMLVGAGVLVGIVGTSLVLQESFGNKVVVGVAVGLLVGSGLVNSLPRQWEEIQSKRQKDAKINKL